MILILLLIVFILWLIVLVAYRNKEVWILELIDGLKWNLIESQIVDEILINIPDTEEKIESLELDSLEDYLIEIKSVARQILNEYGLSKTDNKIHLTEEGKALITKLVYKKYGVSIISIDMVYFYIDEIISEFSGDENIKKLLRKLEYLEQYAVVDD